MKLIGEYQIEVTQIVIRNNSLMNKRVIDFFARTIFFAEIKSVGQYSYRVNNNYAECSVVILDSGEWVKIKEDYNEVNNSVTNWYKDNTVDKNDGISAN